MKRILELLAASALAVLPAAVLAQTADRPDPSAEQQLIEQFGTERLPLTPAVDGPNTTHLVQQGSQNEALVQQRYAGTAALGNLVQIVQAGAANVADVGQYGAANRALVDQQGRGNRVEAQLMGSGIESDIRQRGNQNEVQQDLSQDNRRYLIEQRGNQNELVQRESRAAPAPGYEVQMVGNGIRITIERGQALP